MLYPIELRARCKKSITKHVLCTSENNSLDYRKFRAQQVLHRGLSEFVIPLFDNAISQM
jgi:hypothetical protein